MAMNLFVLVILINLIPFITTTVPRGISSTVIPAAAEIKLVNGENKKEKSKRGERRKKKLNRNLESKTLKKKLCVCVCVCVCVCYNNYAGLSRDFYDLIA